MSVADLQSMIDDAELYRRGAEHEGELVRDDEEPRRKVIALESYTGSSLLEPIAPERYLLPGVPAEAYTLIAGALSSYKTTLMLYLLVWKASGCDILGLDDSGCGAERGKAVLVTYEDTRARVFAKLQRVIQHGYAVVRRQHGERSAREFAEQAAGNLRTLTLTGEIFAGIVIRAPSGLVVRNDAFLEKLLEALRAFAPEGALIGLDPLRLAIVGSQNDDDGADVVVHTLNHLAAQIPNSGLIVASHTSKSGAQEGINDYIGAAYATSGSALYSQHARSNFHMGRLKPEEIRNRFDPKDVTAAQGERQLVTKLTHGRNSHGLEQGGAYLLMDAGTLTRIAPRGSQDAAILMREKAGAVFEAIDRLKAAGVKVSKDALENDSRLTDALDGRNRVRYVMKLLEQNGYVETIGRGRNAATIVTASGRALLPGEHRRDSDKGAQS